MQCGRGRFRWAIGGKRTKSSKRSDISLVHGKGDLMHAFERTGFNCEEQMHVGRGSFQQALTPAYYT